MEYTVCCVPVSPLRAAPSHKAEMVTQQLFGEKSVVGESAPDNWVKIVLKYDNYEGWCQLNQLAEIDKEHYEKSDKVLTAGWVNEVDYNGHRMLVPYGCSLSAFSNGKAFWRKNSVQYKGQTWNPEEEEITPKNIRLVAYKYLNTPYLWGGKSVFGIDCSGFTQMAYKFLNIHIPRDAWQQANEGEQVSALQKARCGDLAFFDTEDGRISHVGLMLNEHEIIHSSGKVRVDKIDNQGIFNLETKQRTHKLSIIKRYF